MKIDFSKKLTNLDGSKIKEGINLKTVCQNALMGAYKGEEALEGDEKARRYDIAIKLNSSNELDLRVEDVKTIKEVIGKAFGPLIVGQAYKIIEGETVKATDPPKVPEEK